MSLVEISPFATFGRLVCFFLLLYGSGTRTEYTTLKTLFHPHHTQAMKSTKAMAIQVNNKTAMRINDLQTSVDGNTMRPPFLVRNLRDSPLPLQPWAPHADRDYGDADVYDAALREGRCALEAIVDERKLRNGHTQYLAKWRDYPAEEASWLSPSSFNQSDIDEWKQAQHALEEAIDDFDADDSLPQSNAPATTTSPLTPSSNSTSHGRNQCPRDDLTINGTPLLGYGNADTPLIQAKVFLDVKGQPWAYPHLKGPEVPRAMFGGYTVTCGPFNKKRRIDPVAADRIIAVTPTNIIVSRDSDDDAHSQGQNDINTLREDKQDSLKSVVKVERTTNVTENTMKGSASLPPAKELTDDGAPNILDGTITEDGLSAIRSDEVTGSIAVAKDCSKTGDATSGQFSNQPGGRTGVAATEVVPFPGPAVLSTTINPAQNEGAMSEVSHAVQFSDEHAV